MSKRMLINYLLLVLIIFFSWVGIKYPVNEEQKVKQNVITTLNPENISEIKIETADDTVVLQKNGTSWSLQNPINWFANNIAAERITTLANLQAQSKLPKDQIDLSTLGLRIPKAVVTLNKTSIYFGDTNQIGNRRYLMVEPTVYLASDIHYIFINQGIAGLLDNRLLPSQLELKELNFPTFKLLKGDTGWTTDPAAKPAQNITQFINNWQQKQASIKPYNKTLTPLHKIKAVLQNGDEIEFYVLSIKPEIIIARPDLNLQYHFPDHQYYELLSLEQKSESASE